MSKYKIKNQDGTVLEEVEDKFDFESDLWDYLEDKVPPLAHDQKCELASHVDVGANGEREDAWATTFFYTIEGDHICYTYVCIECCENMAGDYNSPIAEDTPVDREGYVVEPIHCTP